MLAAERHAQLHHAGDLLSEPHTARALDAAVHLFGRNQRPDILGHHAALGFMITRRTAAVAHRLILQLAFAALIANRAIKRMIDQQKFHHALLRLDRHFRVGVHLHAFRSQGRAGRQRLGRLLDFNQAHAAIGRDGQFFVIAEIRDIDAELVGRVHHRGTALNFYRLAINFNVH